ncbi:MAG: DNA repair protein RecN [Candidatus Eisenbacteria bacterium]
MLRELRIESFALVDRLSVEFGAGLHVLTGETGAGKTVVLEAIAILLGGKSPRPPVREGAESAWIQGLFDVSGVKDFPHPDLVDDEGTILVERRIPRSGRGRAEVNGRLVTQEKLRLLGNALLDIHGQQERENLTDRALQRRTLDAYAGASAELTAWRAAYRSLKEARRARTEAAEAAASAREREDFLRHQAREIDAADLRPGEEEELEGEVRLLKEAERLREIVWFAREELREGDGSATNKIGETAERLDRFAGHGEEAAAAAEACRRALAEIEEALERIDRLEERIDAPEGALDRAMERLEAIAGLKRKHRRSVGEIVAYREEIGREIALIDGGEEMLRELRKVEGAREAEAAAAALALSDLRAKGAKTLARAIEKGVRPLALPKARFEILVERREDPGGDVVIGGVPCRGGGEGVDRVEFRFAANAGEPVLPLGRVASGGELSRVMLAVKRALASAAPTPTAIFDEIDAGVGGDVGERIGEALAEVAVGRQVLCVTHLPAIASLADRHLRVEKESKGGRTVIAVTPLEGEERVEELVRMLGGSSRRAVSVPHAEEILRAARRGKKR